MRTLATSVALGAAVLPVSIGIMSACQVTATPATPAAPPIASSAPTTVTEPSSNAALDAGSVAIAAPNASAAAPAEPLSRWAARPEPGAAFSYVMDGYCVQANVAFVSNATLVQYGASGRGLVALVKDDHLERWDELSRGLNAADGAPGARDFGEIRGAYPDELYMPVDYGGRVTSVPSVLRYDAAKGWFPKYGADLTRSDLGQQNFSRIVGMWGSSPILADVRCGDMDNCPQVGLRWTTRELPGLGSIFTAGFETTDVKVFPAGDVFAAGRACPSKGGSCAAAVRYKLVGRKVELLLFPNEGVELIVPPDITTPVGMLLVNAGGYFSFDGAAWKRLTWAGKNQHGSLHAGPGGVLYAVENGKVERREADGSVTAIAAPGPVGSLTGTEVSAPWGIIDGKPARLDDSRRAFEIVPIARSPFAWNESKTNTPNVDRIWVHDKDDVWLSAAYSEWPSHYGADVYERRRAILHSKPPREVLRCRGGNDMLWEPGPAGLDSFPALATPSCATPFVILAKVSADAKTEFPQTHRFVRQKAQAFEGATFVTFTGGNKRIVGAKMASYEKGKAILALMRAEFPMGRPEMVCADPEGTPFVP